MLRKVPIKLQHRLSHYVRWGLIHTALILFFADLIAAVWPAFKEVWETRSHVAIAIAAFAATVAEYFHDEEEKRESDERSDR